MYEHSEKRIVEQFKLTASLHGYSIEGNVAETPKRSSEGAPVIKGGISGDPDSFSHLSMEERQRLTEEMMGRHKAWVQLKEPMGGKKPIDKR